ncbi:transport protein Trs120 or TRAPPC9 TRAPP II complex subunit-domain-containing protein [Roridomyces roridus]|uniref:Transport protein Trs120 or TRAPPC9 TRAPP II complex subunit-domain-containing protein n=1 Tax=Roridomyces roridus TaxID=1738132 RepID=A0AAD7BWL5_9AGAR|nr:transport protein Trs120 or TRAPPC9 TRAPP II complex subunit-domain-containing protein [Roridomyces roridus]
MDTHAFASLAQVKFLLVPVGKLPAHSFDKYAAELRTFDAIRLGDIPADNKDERARFMPNPLATGYLHLSFPTHPPPFSHLPLSLLRPSHFPLAVIGIAACSKTDALPSILNEFNASLLDIFPAGGMYPLAKNCFVFEEGEENANLNLGEGLPGLVVIPSMMGNKKLYIGTLLADLCSHVLGEFGTLIQALESPAGNEHLNSALMPMLPPLDLAPPLDNGRKRDSLPPLPSSTSQPEMKLGNFPAVPNIKRNSSGSVFRQSTLNLPPPPKKRLSSIGVASSACPDAGMWYNEALTLFKSSSDAIWQAATLEGIATVSIVDAWSAGQGLNTSTSNSREPWGDVSEKLTQAIQLYHRSPTDGEYNYSLLSYLYCSSVLRQASLLFSVWSAKGWGPLAFTTMLHPGPQPYLPPTLSRDGLTSWANLERLSTISGVSRGSISAVLTQVHGPWLLHLGARERISILEYTASIYACLGYRRKEAYILREVLGCILDLIVCGREEDGLSRLSSVPLPGAQGPNNSSSQRGNVGVRFSENMDGNESVLKLLKHICKVLGINLDAVRLVENAEESSTIEEEDADFVEPYGWPELQVGVVREAVAVAEALPDFLAVAQFALSSLKTLQNVLAAGDQHHLYTTSARALTTAHRRGVSKSVEYWSGKPLVNISLSSFPLVRLPIEKPMSALQPRSSGIAPILTGGTDPFLYNPRRTMGQGKSLVVQNEPLEFVLVLRNPYVFDLEIQSLSLSTSGVVFDSKPVRVVLPATSLHMVKLSGKATETGPLVEESSESSRYPLATDEEEERIARKRAALECEAGRSKYSGLDCFPWEKASKRTSTQITTKPSLRFLEYTVVPEQPLLRIRRTSVTHGAVMMYNGEMSTIRITLENVSALPIDFLRLVFVDSTIAPAQQALANGDLSVFDTYETEYDLLHRPVFSWNNDDAKGIAPGQKLTVNVHCFGKVGCINGTIHVSYSYVHRPVPSLDPAPQVFHTRQLSYPVMVTVYHMLECHGMDILPFPSNPLDLQQDQVDSDSQDADETGWCLFSVEVRNTYGLPFEVSFERIQQGKPKGLTTSTVSPGSTCRMIIPIKKFILSESHISQPIPTLSDRQFVVTKSKLSAAQERAQRELFWYREELFKNLRGRWREAGGTRSGDLSLRQQRMSLPMLETLRTETASIHMSLHLPEDPVVSNQGKYYPHSSEFVYLRTRVTNLSLTSLVFNVDFDLKPSQHIIFEGLLRQVAIGRLESGESREIDTGLCFLAHGRYEISAEAKVVGSSDSKGRGQLTAIVRAEG